MEREKTYQERLSEGKMKGLQVTSSEKAKQLQGELEQEIQHHI